MAWVAGVQHRSLMTGEWTLLLSGEGGRYGDDMWLNWLLVEAIPDCFLTTEPLFQTFCRLFLNVKCFELQRMKSALKKKKA